VSEQAAATLFIGVGNAMRGDDGVGPWLAAQLTARGARARAHEGDGADLIAMFREAPEIVLLDATQSGAEPGTILQMEAACTSLSSGVFRRSTHEFGLAEAVETARALGWLPARLMIYGIEGAEFGAGPGLSPTVEAAARRLLDRLAPGSAGAGRPGIAERTIDGRVRAP